MKNKISLVSLVLILGSCSSIDPNNIAPGYVQAYSTIKSSIFGAESDINLEYIDKIPYASMIVKIGKGPSGLMILESISGDKYTWVSADGVYLVIRKGKIIQTQGLPNNLDETINSFKGWNLNFQDQEYITYSSFNNPELKNLKIISTYKSQGIEKVDLQIRSLDLNLLEEMIYAREVGWKKTNQYWLDDQNFVWKSKQSISPRLPEIFYTVTKKPR